MFVYAWTNERYYDTISRTVAELAWNGILRMPSPSS